MYSADVLIVSFTYYSYCKNVKQFYFIFAVIFYIKNLSNLTLEKKS